MHLTHPKNYPPKEVLIWAIWDYLRRGPQEKGSAVSHGISTHDASQPRSLPVTSTAASQLASPPPLNRATTSKPCCRLPIVSPPPNNGKTARKVPYGVMEKWPAASNGKTARKVPCGAMSFVSGRRPHNSRPHQIWLGRSQMNGKVHLLSI